MFVVGGRPAPVATAHRVLEVAPGHTKVVILRETGAQEERVFNGQCQDD